MNIDNAQMASVKYYMKDNKNKPRKFLPVSANQPQQNLSLSKEMVYQGQVCNL